MISRIQFSGTEMTVLITHTSVHEIISAADWWMCHTWAGPDENFSAPAPLQEYILTLSQA